jgi:methionyl-tRNA formyltransferase
MAASAAPTPTDADCALVWSWPVERVLRRIRALAPAPGAFTEIGGQFLTILDARVAADFPRALRAGEGAVVGDHAVIRAGDGAIELLSGEIDGQLLDTRGLVGLVARSRELVIG